MNHIDQPSKYRGSTGKSTQWEVIGAPTDRPTSQELPPPSESSVPVEKEETPVEEAPEKEISPQEKE